MIHHYKYNEKYSAVLIWLIATFFIGRQHVCRNRCIGSRAFAEDKDFRVAVKSILRKLPCNSFMFKKQLFKLLKGDIEFFYCVQSRKYFDKQNNYNLTEVYVE